MGLGEVFESRRATLQITCIKTTPSRKVPQMLASTTSKWGLNGEERAVALLMVRTRPESPEGNLRELIRDSNLNCGIAKERELTWEKP